MADENCINFLNSTVYGIPNKYAIHGDFKVERALQKVVAACTHSCHYIEYVNLIIKVHFDVIVHNCMEMEGMNVECENGIGKEWKAFSAGF